MTESAKPQRRHARANRARILEAAIVAFAADPDASMDEVARTAGVVRRTVYSHFPSREALIEGLADEASNALVTAMGDGGPPTDRHDLALAALALRTWPVGDRFRVLLSSARKELGEQRIRDLLVPVRARSIGLVEQGQRSGTFSSYLPAALLVVMAEAMTMAVLDEVNVGTVTDSGESFAIAYLVLLGIPPDRAGVVADEARRSLHG